MSDVVGAGGQQGIVRDHPATGNPQTEVEAIIIALLRCAVSVVSFRPEPAIAGRAGVDTDRQGQHINRLHRILSLTAADDQPLLNGRFDLPEIGGLTHEQAAISQLGKETRLGRLVAGERGTE